MQQATQPQLSPSRQSLYQPQSNPSLQYKARTPFPRPQRKPLGSKESLPQELDKDKTVMRHIPRLRAVVESQAFKNVLVDEMDMMLSRAATLIQANWRGYRLRQKLVSQMMAAKAIQEAWRRFNMRRLLRSGKSVEKKVSVDEGDIPYHPPQQVRFQHPGESESPLGQPIMVSKETQFPSSDSLDVCTHRLALHTQSTPQPGMQAPCPSGGPSVTFLPHQTIAIRLPCPVSLDAKCHPCLLTRPVRNACLGHIEGDTVKTKQVTTRANKSGVPGPPPSRRYAQAGHRPLKTQTQAHMEPEVFKVLPQTGPAPVTAKILPLTSSGATITKTPPQPWVVPMGTIAKTPPQMYPAARMTKTPTQTYPAASVVKTPLQACLAAIMNKTPAQPCSAPTVTVTKSPPQTSQVGPMAKTSPQTSQPATATKTPFQSCLAAMMTKTPSQPCPAAPASKTPTQMRATTSVTNASPQTRPAAMMAKISPQICLLASMIKAPTQTRPVATSTKTPPQTCSVPTMAKAPTQMRPASPTAKAPLQTCTAAATAKTPSQTLTGASVTKTPPQTRLAAMVTKTPAQFRSMAAIIRTLCLPPPTAGNLKSSPPVTVAAGIPNTSSHTYLNGPKAKAVGNAKQTTGMVKISSHSYLADGKVKYFPPPQLGAGTPKAPARPPLEAEKVKAFSQKQVKTETTSNMSVAVEMPRASPWAKVVEDSNKSSLQTHLRTDVVKIQSQVYVPEETAVVLPQAQLTACPAKAPDPCLAKALPQEWLATCPATASSQGQLLAELTVTLPQARLGTCLAKTLSKAYSSTKLTKTQSQGHPPAEVPTAEAQSHLGMCLSKTLSQARPSAKVTKTPSFAHLGTCLSKAQSQAHLATGVIKVQSQARLPTGLTKVQSQAQLVTGIAKCLCATPQPAELSGKTQSQPLLAGFKASSQPCQHVGALGTLPQAKLEDRLTQPQPHSNAQGKATQGPCQGASEIQSILVPLLASARHPTCSVESWGDSGVTRAQPSMTGPATPCQEELAASQLASLCAQLAAELGSQEDLWALLAKALSQGPVRAALSQALTKKVLGTTMARALPQGLLGTALMKVLSWGELGIALSRTLTPTELRAELTKAKQGKLADVLSKALTEEEWAALSQALCQGELGAVLSQSLSQAALRTGVVPPKATSKTAGSRMTVMPAPVEVGSPSAVWGPALGPARPQPSKVRVPQDGVWGGFFTGRPGGFLAEMGDGAMLGGSPCSSVVSLGALLTCRVITTVHQYSLIAALDPSLSWEMGPTRDSSSNLLYLNPEVSEENVWLPLWANELASDLNPVESDTGPNLPKPSHLQPPPSLWQPLIANGVGPSTSRPSVAGGTAAGSHRPHVSRVAPRARAASRQGRAAPGTPSRPAGDGRACHSRQCTAAYGNSVSWCQPSRASKVPPSVCRSSATEVPQQSPAVREDTRQKTQSPNHKRASVDPRERTNKEISGPQRAASVSKAPLTQPQTPKACDTTLGLLPGSVAPSHRWTVKTQVDSSVFQASPGSRMAHTLPSTAHPRQERNRTKGTISSPPRPREQATGHIPNGPSLPQGLDNDLFGSLSQGSTDCGPNVSNSQSSLPSCSSLSLSTMSVASLTAVDLVEEEPCETSLDEDVPVPVDALLSGEAAGRPQGPSDREETRKVSWQHSTPNLCRPPSAGSELMPILHHSSLSGCVTLSVHWGADDQDERGMCSGQSAMDLKESLSQKSHRTGLTRSVSLGNVPTRYQQPSAPSRLTSSLSQPSVAGDGPQQPFIVHRVTASLSESSMASKVSPSPTEPSMASKVTPHPAWPSMTSGATSSLDQPSVTSGVAPNVDQASVTSRVTPNLAKSSVTDRVALNLVQPSMTDGVPLSLAQPSVTSRVTTSLAKPPVTSRVTHNLDQASVTSGVTPNLDQASMTSGVTPNLAKSSVTGGVAPCLAQPSVASGVTPSLAQPSVTSGVAPNLAQPSVTSGVTANLMQAFVTGWVAPSLAQPFVTGGMDPSLAQPHMTDGVAPNLAQPSITSGVIPSLAKSSIIGRMAPSLAQPSVAYMVAPSLARPSVACMVAPSPARPPVMSGTSCAVSQSSWAPKVGSNLPSSRVNAVAPSLHHPSFVTEVPLNTSYPSGTSSMGQGLSQASGTPGMDPCQDPVMVSGVASNRQAPEFSEVSLAFHQPLGVSGRHSRMTEHSAVACSAPDLYQVPVASGDSSCLVQGTSVSLGTLFRGMATDVSLGAMAAGMFPSMSQGTPAAGMFLGVSPGPMCPGMVGSVCQGSVATSVGPNQFQVASGMSPGAPPASVAGAPLIREQPSEASPGFSQVSVSNRLGMSPSRFSQASVGPTRSQVSVDLPIPLSHQNPSVSTVVAADYQQANAFSQEPVMGTVSGLVPGAVAGSVAPSLPPGSVIRGVGQSLPPGLVIGDVPPHLPPGYVVSDVAQTLPPRSVICGISHSLPPGSVISDMGQGLPPDPMASAGAQNFPLGSVASGMARTLPPGSVTPSLIATPGTGGERQRFPIRSSVSFTAPSLVPGSVVSGVTLSVSPGSVASSMVPASMAGGLNQGLVLGSRASAAGLPSTVGNVAQSLPQGSLLIGITPRPYHGSLAVEGPIAPFQVSRAPGLAQLQPHTVEASGTTRRVPQTPTVLRRASQLNHALGMMPFETTDDQIMMKAENLEKALSLVSTSSGESIGLEASPWVSHSLLSNNIYRSLEFLPNCQRLLLEEVVPSKTKSLASGMAPVPPQSLNMAKHSMAGGITPTLQQRPVTTWGGPGSHFVTAGRVPSVHTESVKATGAPLAHQQATVVHVPPSPSVVRTVSQNPLVAHIVPQSHAHKTDSSTIVSGSPRLARGSTIASTLHPGSVAGMGTPSTSQKLGATRGASHVPLHPPMVGGVASGGLHMETVPSTHQKSVSGDLAQAKHKFLGSKKSYRSIQGSLVSEMLDDSVARIVSLRDVREHARRSPRESPEHFTGAPPAIAPITHTEATPNVAIPRLYPRFRRVSLGYETSPDGSRKPLLTYESMQGSQDSHSAVAPADSHKVSLTPTVLQGPVDAGIAGGQARNPAVPSVAVRPMNSAVAPSGPWEPPRAPVPRDTVGREAAVDPRQSGELLASMQAVEKMIVRAVVTIQAGARGYLVRRTIKVWHQWAIIIQAAWRGYCVRRELAQLSRAATVIQALWRGFCTRRGQTQPAWLSGTWAGLGGRTRSTSDHRCFQSCQSHVCPLCRSLSPRVGSPPSVVMLVGSSPRTCHMCGHTLPTRVVHGMGRGALVQAGTPWGGDPQTTPRSPPQSRNQNKAATAIQSAWRGFTARRQLRQQQGAAKMLQATWRGHHTRAALTTDALLGPAAWDSQQHMQWLGV